MNDNWSGERKYPPKMIHYLLCQNIRPGMSTLSIEELVGKLKGLHLLVGRRVIVLRFALWILQCTARDQVQQQMLE
jgi:hypothetical protein